jgi:hypothetical protein
MYGASEKGGILKVKKKLMLFRRTASGAVHPQGHAVTEEKPGILRLDFDKTAVTFRHPQGSATEKTGVTPWVPVKPGEFVRRALGDNPGYSFSTHRFVKLCRKICRFGQFDHDHPFDSRKILIRSRFPPKKSLS